MRQTSEQTKQFYDNVGWSLVDGKTVDAQLFHDREMGPIRAALQTERQERVREALRLAGPPLNLLEVGCGGNPAIALLDMCSHYTGVDFSRTGLEVARDRLLPTGVAFELKEAKANDLPFADQSFDATYSAHALYHIPMVEEQAAAFREIARVTRRGGIAVFLMVNPRPLLSPVRLAVRLVADTPYLGDALNRVRPKPPLPYRPMPMGWMKAQLAPFGDVSFSCHILGSTWQHQHISEHRVLGKLFWRAAHQVERRFAPKIARLGNYVQIVLQKRLPVCSPAGAP
jgi:ubiquinone/menaquinone biosynthesis C-methylase UbiE